MKPDDLRLALIHATEDTNRVAQSWADLSRALPQNHALATLVSNAASTFFQVLEQVNQHSDVQAALKSE